MSVRDHVCVCERSCVCVCGSRHVLVSHGINEEEGWGVVSVCVCIYVCNHGPMGKPVNHNSVSSMAAHMCACVHRLPGGLSLPAELLCESEVSPLELPSALIWS